MRDHSGITAAGRVGFGRRALRFLFRAAFIASTSFAGAFGFLSATANPAVAYDPHLFATGIAALFGAAWFRLISCCRPVDREPT